MAIQQQKLSALLARNVSTMVSSQNKIKFPVFKCFTNITVITSRSYGIALLSTQLDVICKYLQIESMVKLLQVYFIFTFQIGNRGSSNVPLVFTVILVIFGLACIVLCHYIAKKRGANPVFWGVMGGIFGPFAIPFVFFSKRKSQQQNQTKCTD